jgi:hypothetical protein
MILPGFAAEVTGGGTITFVGYHPGSPRGPGGMTLGQHPLRGGVLPDDPANPMHMAAHDCIGGSIFNPAGEEDKGAGYCDAIDADGDVAFIAYFNHGDDRSWVFLGGSGTFDGIEGGGTTAVVGGTPDGRVVIRGDGVWTMKD